MNMPQRRVYLEDRDGDDLQINADGSLNTDATIQNASIEQTTGAAHNDLNVAVAGKDTSGNVQPLSTSTDGSLITNIRAVDSPSIDAFARLRVSNPTTIFDSKQIFDNGSLYWDDQEVSGAGTSSTHSVDNARTRIAVSNTTAGKRTRQTFMRFNYQPGKSQLILLTGVLGTGASGITQQIGYFDDDNGLIFSCEDAVMYVVRRTNVTGTAADNKVAQSAWNLDKMDGTGASGITLDFSKTQIMLIDFEWLGVGRVRMGFVIDGIPVYCHQFLNTNNLTEVYMSTPNLPIRYSIENDGTGGATSLDHICSSVVSEGGSEDLGVLRQKSTGTTTVDCAVVGTTYEILSIRLKSTHLSETVKIIKAVVSMTSTSDDLEWFVIFNPTISGSPSYTSLAADSAIEFHVGTGGTVTGGTPLDAGYISTGTGQSASGVSGSSTPNALRLGSFIDGTQQNIALCAKSLTNVNAIVRGGLTWRELS